jgi:sugar phosphate isomerase/epimerase
MAIEIPLQEIIEAAVKAGWDETEVMTAIIEVADNLMLAAGANAEVDELLKALRSKPDR